ncbi:uncharacterized protein LOC125836859 [Solanum verrucosum]|uniref:uncharacterized protein LOC125836859 n=1 Tax=Solanum verrucosum TaxID=315347 RepID=UPI0020D148A4|nr:uncharacterized protein LOC125836859 [Solanum verrucosum]
MSREEPRWPESSYDADAGNQPESSYDADAENFIEELKKWKEGRTEDAPPASWACFEEVFLGRFFPRELKEAKVEEEKLRDREEFRSKKVKTRNESGQHKGNVNCSSFQQKQKGPALSSASVPAPRNKGEYNGQNSHSFRARPAQAAPRGVTFDTGGGANHLYAITSRQE